jgi:hypothetical protein
MVVGFSNALFPSPGSGGRHVFLVGPCLIQSANLFLFAGFEDIGSPPLLEKTTALNGAPPNKALQRTWHSTLQSGSGRLLASTLGASATVGGLCHAAERLIRQAARAMA